jgi:hypothetical protein
VRPRSEYSLSKGALAACLFSFGCLVSAGGAGRALAAPVPDVNRTDFRPATETADDASQPDEPVAHVPLPLTIALGERLVYDIRWSGMPAGRSVLLVKYEREIDGSPVYHIECRTNSNAFLDMMYPVDDRIITVMDVEEGFSRLFEMSIKEGRVERREHIRFDYEAALATYERFDPGPFKPRSRKAVRVDGHMQDPLSCLYYLRELDLTVGETVYIPVHTARRAWTLAVDVLRREELEIPGFGKLPTLRIEPVIRFPGIFVRKGRMAIWLHEATRVPVLMHVDIPVGSVSVTLTGTEKSPLLPIDAEPAETE